MARLNLCDYLQRQSRKILFLCLIVLLIFCDNRLEQLKRQEAETLNSLMLQRDKDHNRVYHRITYEELVKQEKIQKIRWEFEKEKIRQEEINMRKQKQEQSQKPTEIFFPDDQVKRNQGQNKQQQNKLKERELTLQKKLKKDQSNIDQELLFQLSQNITTMLQEKLHSMTQEDLEFLIKRGYIDETQALMLFEIFFNKQPNNASQSGIYTLQNDLIIGGYIPLVYSLHLGFLILTFAISMVHKHFTLRIHVALFLGVKLIEIIYFYLFALYLQNSGCIYFSIAVHIIFDLTIYNLLLDVLSFLSYQQEDFEFNFNTGGSKEKLKSKIVFNLTLLSISYISCIQFTSLLASFFLYWYSIFLVYRLVVFFKDEKLPLKSEIKNNQRESKSK